MLADEPVGAGKVGGVQDLAAGFADGVSASVVDVCGGVQSDPGVAMLVAVPAEEPVAEDAGVLDAAEPVGEVRPVLQGLELRLGVGVVIRAVRPAVGLGDSEVGEQERDRFGGH